MFKSFYIMNCNKDNVIHSHYTNANLGKSYALPLVKNDEGVSTTNKFSRLLLDFNFDELIDFIGLDSLTSNSFTATLKLVEYKYTEFLHNLNYDIEYKTLTANWVEGYNEEKDFSATGYSNYLYRAYNNSWGLSGGDFISSISGFQTLDNGYEDLELDVTDYVENYVKAKYGLTGLASGITTTADLRGFIVKFTNYFENLEEFSEEKIFYSSHSHTIFNPKIYVQIDKGHIYDNRNNLLFNKYQTLYFPYRLDGEIQELVDYFVAVYGESYYGQTYYDDSETFNFEIKIDNQSITGLSYTASVVDGIMCVNFTLPELYYSSTSIYYDIWTIADNISLTGRFKAYRTSDYVASDYFSLTGNFNKNYISKNIIEKFGVIAQFNNEMYYDSEEYLKFNPFISKNKGVDNAGLLFNNDLVFPSEFFVKFIDVETNYELTNWIKLDLLNDAYILTFHTKSFKINKDITFLYKMKYNDSYKVIKARKQDIFKIRGI